MEFQVFSRSKSLNNISERKFDLILKELDRIVEQDSSKIAAIAPLKTSFIRYFESNIPIEYWRKSMDKDFVGNPKLKTAYENYVSDVRKSFVTGTSICFAGPHGTGKTLTMCNILKRTVEKGYTALYTTLSDIVAVLTTAPKSEVYIARKELLEVDFLLIDEYDNRFISTENSSDLFARTLESIFRTRKQNSMPTLFCTNSPNVLNSFNGSLKESLSSIMSSIKFVTIMGKDFRKNNE